MFCFLLLYEYMKTPKIVLALGKHIRHFNKYDPATTYVSSSATFVLEYKVRNRIYWKISNAAICRIYVALNIKFNSNKSHRDAKNCRYCNFQGFWNQLQIQKCFLRQSLTKYLETNLRNKVKQNLYEKFHGSFCSIFLRYCPIYIFWKETED